MKSINKLLAILFVAGLAAACTPGNRTSEGREDTEADSVEQVAPAEDGTPTDGTTPSNPGSPADSAAQAVEPDSIR